MRESVKLMQYFTISSWKAGLEKKARMEGPIESTYSVPLCKLTRSFLNSPGELLVIVTKQKCRSQNCKKKKHQLTVKISEASKVEEYPVSHCRSDHAGQGFLVRLN